MEIKDIESILTIFAEGEVTHLVLALNPRSLINYGDAPNWPVALTIALARVRTLELRVRQDPTFLYNMDDPDILRYIQHILAAFAPATLVQDITVVFKVPPLCLQRLLQNPGSRGYLAELQHTIHKISPKSVTFSSDTTDLGHTAQASMPLDDILRQSFPVLYHNGLAKSVISCVGE